MRIGLVSDTHGLLDPGLTWAFAGADLVLHAGDVVGERVLEGLREIAPVTAVRGNCDEGTALGWLPDLARLSLGDLAALVVHDAGKPGHRPRPLAAALAAGRAHLVVSGHSHRPGAALVDGTLFVNPGSAGPRRFRLPRCAAVLDVRGRRARVEWVDLAHPGGKLLPPLEVTL